MSLAAAFQARPPRHIAAREVSGWWRGCRLASGAARKKPGAAAPAASGLLSRSPRDMPPERAGVSGSCACRRFAAPAPGSRESAGAISEAGSALPLVADRLAPHFGHHDERDSPGASRGRMELELASRRAASSGRAEVMPGAIRCHSFGSGRAGAAGQKVAFRAQHLRPLATPAKRRTAAMNCALPQAGARLRQIALEAHQPGRTSTGGGFRPPGRPLVQKSPPPFKTIPSPGPGSFGLAALSTGSLSFIDTLACDKGQLQSNQLPSSA